ncbi:MAG: uroporphyrinogen-III synthase, partial [Planctomycetota bacterium]
MTLPLWRRRVVVTRPRARAGRWVEAFTAAGADVILFPVFEMRAAPAEENDRALRLLRDLLAERPSIPRPWIALTSAASAEHFTALLDSVDLLDEARAQFRFAAVGPATRAALAARGVEAALSPEHASGAAVAREILQVAAVPPV